MLSNGQGFTLTSSGYLGVSKGTVSRCLRIKLSPRWARQEGKLWFRGEDDPIAYNPEEDSYAGPIVAKRKAKHKRDREQDRERRKVTPEPVQETGTCDVCADMWKPHREMTGGMMGLDRL